MNCFCGANTFKMPSVLPVWRGLQFSLWQCVDCRHVRVLPLPDKEQLSSYYHLEYKRLRGFLDKLIVRDIMAMITKRVTGSIHDYGCGDGYLLEELSKSSRGLVVTGYDTDEESISKARERGLWGVWSDPSTHAHADLVTLNHCLEHSPYPIKTLVHAAGSMTPSANMVIRVPNANFGHTMEDFTKWIWCGIPWHLNYFTPNSIKAALRGAGLAAVSVYCSEYREQAPPEIHHALVRDLSAEELVAVARRA